MSLEHDLCTIFESSDNNYRASVAIVQQGDKWLLGLSTSDDDRNNKWAFPGGGIKKNESPEDAAVREAFEETGVHCTAKGKAFKHNKKDVAFVHCKCSKKQKLVNNSEFVALGFFTTKEMKSLKLYDNVKDLIRKVKNV